MDNQHLPPLPPSDADSLSRNYYDRFYQRSSRSFWGQNSIEYIKDEPMKTCDHYFQHIQIGIVCKSCGFGFNGHGLTLKDGKLFYGNEQLFKR